MLFLIALYLFLVIVLPLGLSAMVSFRTLPEGRACPICQGDSIRLVARWLRVPSALLRGSVLHRRWCPACSWEGVARVRAPARHARTAAAQPQAGTTALAQARETGEAITLRRIEVNGRPWQVLLQCWSGFGAWYGRLVFIAPSGRLWADTTQSFNGSTPDEVLGQALALSEGVLTGRLRELTSG